MSSPKYEPKYHYDKDIKSTHAADYVPWKVVVELAAEVVHMAKPDFLSCVVMCRPIEHSRSDHRKQLMLPVESLMGQQLARSMRQ